MTVHMLTQEYQTAGEKAAIKRWLNRTVALRIDQVNTKEQNGRQVATSLAVTVFTVTDTDTGEPARIESSRIIGQLAGYAQGDTVVVHVVPLGKRGQVLAPPAEGDKDAAALAKALS